MRVLLILLISVSQVWAAADPGLQDFARGIRLLTDSQSAIYHLPLPGQVYETMVRDDLGDLRVFNNSGEIVPRAIRRSGIQQTGATVRLDVPVFPVIRSSAELAAESSMDLEIDANGAIIRVRPGRNTRIAENEEISHYLIDLSGVKQNIARLDFGMTGSDAGYIRRFTLQSSTDLNTWQPLVADASLASFDYGSYSLHKNSVNLPGRQLKYLRFNWLDADAGGLRINSITAVLSAIATVQQRHTRQLTGIRAEAEMQLYEYDSGARYPVDRININLPEENTLFEAILRSRKGKDADWRIRHRGLFYKLVVDGNHLQQGELSINRIMDRYWQLEILTNNGAGSEAPLLELGWVPDDLYFLARGQGPYVLAFGNAQINAPDQPVDALMNVLGTDVEDKLAAAARPGEELVLKGDAALLQQRKIPWQRIMLWAVLLCGVLVTAVMAWRLVRQINTAETNT
jgi:hypothetical protein